ncbi:MAG: hypothetical protein N2037_06435 [Acidimicrobiales bacterium]|nr:hypothetical protein [Acidimicrobiales bacterium]
MSLLVDPVLQLYLYDGPNQFMNIGPWKAALQSQSQGVEAAIIGNIDMLPKVRFPETSNWNNYNIVRYGWSNGIPKGVGFHFTVGVTNTRYYSWAGVDEFDVTVFGYEHMQIGWTLSQSGDSGGPVYTVHQDAAIAAGGIASFGEASANCDPVNERMVWGRSSRALNGLGATLLTG